MKAEQRLELEKICVFIDAWTQNNKYTPEKLHEHNAKFRTDLATFFSKADFKFEKVEYYIN